jgi:hypothetical protein
MPPTTSFWEHPLEKLEEALHIRKQIAALEDKLRSMFGGKSDGVIRSSSALTKDPRNGKRSAAVRAKMAAAQRARWAKSKGETSTPVVPKKKGKRTMSPEAKAKIAAAQKERWAKVKGARASTSAAKIETKAPKAKKKRNITPEGRAKMLAAVKRRWAKAKAAKVLTAKAGA